MWSAIHITGLLVIILLLQFLPSPSSFVHALRVGHGDSAVSLCHTSILNTYSTQPIYQIAAQPSWLHPDHVSWNCSSGNSTEPTGIGCPQIGILVTAPGPSDIANLTTANVLRFDNQTQAARFKARLERASSSGSKDVLTLENLLALASPTSIYFAALWYSFFVWPPLHPSIQLLIASICSTPPYPYIFRRAVASLKARARFKLAKSLSQDFSVRAETLVILLISSLTRVNF